MGADGASTERLQLDLAQSYQVARGTVDSVRLEQVRLRGDSLAFSAGGRRFAGRVSGDEARGSVIAEGASPMRWRAVRTGRP